MHWSPAPRGTVLRTNLIPNGSTVPSPPPPGIGAASVVKGLLVYWKAASYFSPHGGTGQVPSETQQEPVILTSGKLLGNDNSVARRWGALDRTGRCLVITGKPDFGGSLSEAPGVSCFWRLFRIHTQIIQDERKYWVKPSQT